MSNPSTTRILYRQTQLPIFQNRMYDSKAEAINCPKGDIELVEDLQSGLVQNAAFQPELMVYDAYYQNEQATSTLFQSHLDEIADLVQDTMGCDELVEVGCGKGYFLEKLLDQGVGIVGFDPTYEGENPRVTRDYFGPDLGISGKGLILRHVLEHIYDPIAFLHQLAQANGRQGLVYIEVPCFDWICKNRAWFDIFYEHVNYFRLTDFKRMFGRIVHADWVFGGQYLAIVADLATLHDPKINNEDRATFPDNFSIVIPAKSQADKIIVWGGASKGVIFSLLCERAGFPVANVIDINPAKQGKYLAATGLQVQSPKQALADVPYGSTIYVMNPNYLEEIRLFSQNKYNYVEMSND
ncbi:MAG: class I SAM-dependent methyltransferase [Planktomarina sp.]|nr:class I SAM-dependent methyltransferase [Planktomarina sp.]